MFYLKYLNLPNFKMLPLKNVVANHGDAKDSHVKLQLSVLEEDEELIEDNLRFDALKAFLSAVEEMRGSKGLSLYKSSRNAEMIFRQGKTAVVPGFRGIKLIQDDLKWTPVFGRSGLCFVLLEQPHNSFKRSDGVCLDHHSLAFFLYCDVREFFRDFLNYSLFVFVRDLNAAPCHRVLEARCAYFHTRAR